MIYNVLTIPVFEKQVKVLFKKYSSLKVDFHQFVGIIEKDPTSGIPLGNNFYKVRFSISSLKKGKSGSARIITYVRISEKNIYLTFIYEKSSKNNISKKELQQIFKEIN